MSCLAPHRPALGDGTTATAQRAFPEGRRKTAKKVSNICHQQPPLLSLRLWANTGLRQCRYGYWLRQRVGHKETVAFFHVRASMQLSEGRSLRSLATEAAEKSGRKTLQASQESSRPRCFSEETIRAYEYPLLCRHEDVPVYARCNAALLGSCTANGSDPQSHVVSDETDEGNYTSTLLGGWVVIFLILFRVVLYHSRWSLWPDLHLHTQISYLKSQL